MSKFSELIQKLLGLDKGESATVAKERLKLVLIHDRVKLTPDEVENMKKDLIEAISRYVDIDQDCLEVSLTRKGNMTSIVADIPVKPRKSQKSKGKKPQGSTIKPAKKSNHKKKGSK
jgi:cell division topological specificity factor